MSKPASIKKFDVLWLGAIAVGLIGLFIGWDAMVAQMSEQLAEEGMDLESGIPTAAIIGGVAFGTAINLAIWFVVSVLRVEFVKWILIAFTIYGIFTMIGGIRAAGFNPVQLSGIISTVMSVAALYFLFTPEARAWFEEKRAAKRDRPDMDGGVDLK